MQLGCLAESVEGCHENYGLAFYVPSSGDRASATASEWMAKYESIDRDFAAYLGAAERAVKIALRQSDDGRILLFAGGGAFNGRPDYSAYAVAKAGVVSLMETLAAEEQRVTVNCVSPGRVSTPMIGCPDAPSPEKDRAVACVMHLLSDQTQGLTGSTISAEYDQWDCITQENVESINDSLLGKRHRYRIVVRELVRVAV